MFVLCIEVRPGEIVDSVARNTVMLSRDVREAKAHGLPWWITRVG